MKTTQLLLRLAVVFALSIASLSQTLAATYSTVAEGYRPSTQQSVWIPMAAVCLTDRPAKITSARVSGNMSPGQADGYASFLLATLPGPVAGSPLSWLLGQNDPSDVPAHSKVWLYNTSTAPTFSNLPNGFRAFPASQQVELNSVTLTLYEWKGLTKPPTISTSECVYIFYTDVSPGVNYLNFDLEFTE